MAVCKSPKLPLGAEKSRMPDRFDPMLLHSEKVLKPRDGWSYEPKLDGMRAIAILSGGVCKLLSRNGRDITKVFPEISSVLTKQKNAMVLDAEIIAVGDDGRPDFEALQSRWLLTRTREIERAMETNRAAMFAFDMLHFENHSLANCKLSERRKLLFHSLLEHENLRAITSFDDGPVLLEACRQQKLEGVVAKRNDSLYRQGTRSKDWIKVKFTETDSFVVVGYRKDDGFLVKHRADDQSPVVGAVQYGFSDANYHRLISVLKPVTRTTRYKSDQTLWFEPNTWIEVEFMQWTKSGKLRFPVFKNILRR
jgi:bifunctional non-homologous end joining protein LigD